MVAMKLNHRFTQMNTDSFDLLVFVDPRILTESSRTFNNLSYMDIPEAFNLRDILPKWRHLVRSEHRHIGGAEGYGPKMEAWQVRYGEVTFYGEYKGEGTEVPFDKIPESKRPWGCGEAWMKSKYAITRTAKSGKRIACVKLKHLAFAGCFVLKNK